MTIDLSAARAKLHRAHEHRDALEAELGPVYEGKRYPIQMSAKLDPDSGYHVFRVTKIPDEWLTRMGVLLGDIIYNLRSALDQLAWELVLDHSGRPKRPTQKTSIEYPIKYSRSKLTSTYTFNRVSHGDQTILDRTQPYSSRGNPKLYGLAVIQQLSNRDKHRAINPMLVSTDYFTVKGTPLEGKGIFDIDWIETRPGQRLKVGTDFMRFKAPPDVDDEVEVAGYAAPDVRLPQGNYRLYVAVDAVLIELVEAIIDMFAAHHGV